MRPDARDAAYLWDMLDAAREIREFVKGLDLDMYLGNRMAQAAVERKVGIIGEAARQLSDGYKKAHPEGPWKKIIGQRNFLVHEYGDIVQERMWLLVSESIPELIALLESLIPPAPQLPEE